MRDYGMDCGLDHGIDKADSRSGRSDSSARIRRDEECSSSASLIPLRLASEGEWVRVVSLNGCRGFHDRLSGVGIRIGGKLEVIRNRMDGKLLLGLDGTRLFLGGGMAQKINVVIEGGGRV